jgi:hypothetical protein
MLEKNRCIPLAPGPKYPSCQDATIKGDAAFSLGDLDGKWCTRTAFERKNALSDHRDWSQV